ncbi:root phototropism protein 2-like [Phragmites australis]|uniref:root phototropism protein 2-like n=1 Tax=Phragmites australis TaxID=29695 RepID=UPI002D785B2F|nr:root phototropism protein 2-like [Phragmites australis]
MQSLYIGGHGSKDCLPKRRQEKRREEPMQASSGNSSRFPASMEMERICQWVSSTEIPTDLTIRIGDSVFPLHKAVMVPKCGYISRAVAAARKDPPATVELDLSALPGGADAFEKAARYCYGAKFEITAPNAAGLRCAAAFLDMQQPADGGLARRVEEFLAQTGLRTLPSAVAVLRSCEGLLPAAEELGIVRRSSDAVALKICNEVLFPTRSPPGWWVAELASLSPASFQKVVTALRCRRADPEVLATAATAYAELVLAEVLADPRDRESRALLESVVTVLPSATDAPLPAAFLCRLLHAAVSTEASAKTCRDLELRVAAVLDQATAGDLLAVALDGAGDRVTNTDTVRRVIAAFVERQAASEGGANGRSRRASLSGAELGSVALEKVAKTVDEVAAELATEEALPISKFVAVAGAVPKGARASHDCLYRAVDIYLKTHPALDEIEREKVCSVMDPLKLSYQGRLHASQNKRLPLQAALSALYYDQLELRSEAGADDGGWEWDRQSAAGKARAQARADASLAQENEALRSELARMRAYVSGMQHSKGSGSRASPAKKASFLGSVSRTLSRLNPFKGGWAKDTSSIADGRHRNTMHDHHVGKPKRRRFSIG